MIFKKQEQFILFYLIVLNFNLRLEYSQAEPDRPSDRGMFERR